MDDSSYLIGYLLASEYRKKVMNSLKDSAFTPGTISKKTELHLSHVSLTLKQLVEKKLVICLTPKLKKGRLYDLTKTGKDLLKHIS